MLDIVICVGPKDHGNIQRCVQLAKKNILNARQIYLIVSDIGKFNNKDKDVLILDENIFPFHKNDFLTHHIPPERIGWYLQQLLKLYAGQIIPDILPDYLVLDADTFFLLPISFLTNDVQNAHADAHAKADAHHANYHFSIIDNDPPHLPYFVHMQKLHPTFRPSSPESGIAHHMIFHTPYVKEMMQMVETYHKNMTTTRPFWHIFLSCVDREHVAKSGASEYELYFHFMQRQHASQFKRQKLKMKNISSPMEHIPPDLHYVSMHWWHMKKTSSLLKIPMFIR